MSAREKFLAAALLFVAWGALVVLDNAPVEPFIAAIRDALVAIGVFTTTIAKGPQ